MVRIGTGRVRVLAMEIVYRFRLSEDAEFVWGVDVEGPPREHTGQHADWTRLGNNQCKNCPLDSAEHEYCPAALDIEGVAEAFVDTVSYDRVDVRVETENRIYEKNCDFQEAIRSLFGLLMSTSECPVLARLKPMAHSHLPFSTLQETIQRMAGLYLIKAAGAAFAG